MQDLLGTGDARKVKSAAGLAGGIGHRGAVCGIVTGGALALALSSTRADEDQAQITARGSRNVGQFIRRFVGEAGDTLCRNIIRTDFDDDRQLRRYILTRSLTCVRLASRAASILVDIIDRPDQIGDGAYERLNQRFSGERFHCAYSVVMKASEQLNIHPIPPPPMVIPLNGGLGYEGRTCAALLGGCLVIGLQNGGDTSETSMILLLRRLVLKLVHGSAAFNRLDLSPANDALLRCSELFGWFLDRYSSTLCRELTRTDFHDDIQARRYFEEGGLARCREIADETAGKASELAR